ncbi:hypothetical protein [Gelria sp. Kuro-4]|jgi:hypothetical protein|nr:hypothetical protein [Gelria sp. Kuro-4]MDI3522186.1 hypothetical protein [Bacillota bacterium]BCV23493.1 hypothetical protein kuro4_02660 [Gelria sp. Kuro-4]
MAERKAAAGKEKRQLVGVRKEDVDRLRGRRRLYDPERGPENKD